MTGIVRPYVYKGEVRLNTWHLIYDLPRGADGKRKRRWVTFHGTAEEAKEELACLVEGAEAAPIKGRIQQYVGRDGIPRPNHWQLIFDGPRKPGGKRNQIWKTFHGTEAEARAELPKLIQQSLIDWENELKYREASELKKQRISAERRSWNWGRKKARSENDIVYVVGPVENPSLVKIGVTSNFPNRFAALQTGYPRPLKLWLEFKGSYPLENVLHTQFKEFQTFGEWFDFEGINPLRIIRDVARKHGYEPGGVAEERELCREAQAKVGIAPLIAWDGIQARMGFWEQP